MQYFIAPAVVFSLLPPVPAYIPVAKIIFQAIFSCSFDLNSVMNVLLSGFSPLFLNHF